MSITPIVKNLKENGQDFEFYPTTKEIIKTLYKDLNEEYPRRGTSILDIGAGTGKLFFTLKELRKQEQEERKDKYTGFDVTQYKVIEKSQMLITQLPNETIVVGTDFNENTLIDKQAGVIFSNPPYSEYSKWTTKIIKEANSDIIYLVLPQRWGKNKSILEAIKKRKLKVKTLGSFNFNNSEDRKARTRVHLIKLKFNRYSNNKDPFELWFNETFKIKAKKDDWSDYERARKEQEKKQEKIKQEIVKGDTVEVLVRLYNEELNKLLSNYKQLELLDSDLLKELNININSLQNSLKEKIKNLKLFYWKELFDKLDVITSRLTTTTREELSRQFFENSNIDFTEGNIKSVVIWVVKNANVYFDKQLLSLFDDFAYYSKDNSLKPYKSNERFIKDEWKHQRPKDNFYLDYRVISQKYLSDWDIRDGMVAESQKNKILDTIVIAKNLGFEFENNQRTRELLNSLSLRETGKIYFKSNRILKVGEKTNFGKIEEIYHQEDLFNNLIQYKIDGQWYHKNFIYSESDVFAEVRAYQNGNVHFKFNKKFMSKFNLAVGKLRNWLKTPQEASEKLNISLSEAQKMWHNTNFKIEPNQSFKLLNSK